MRFVARKGRFVRRLLSVGDTNVKKPILVVASQFAKQIEDRIDRTSTPGAIRIPFLSAESNCWQRLTGLTLYSLLPWTVWIQSFSREFHQP